MPDELNLPKKRIIKANASVWKRVFAFFMDFLIIRFIIMAPFSTIIQERMPIPENFEAYFQFLQTNQELINSFAPMMFAMFALIFAYFVVFEWKLKQTPGKMIFKLRVVPEKNIKLSVWRIAVRNLFALPFGPLLILLILDPIYVFVTKKRLTEILSKTYTIEEVAI